jgi:uncharacterized protein
MQETNRIAFDAPEPRTADTYRFGGFLLDVRRRLLIHGKQSQPLPEKVCHILLVLLEADGRPVSKEQFFSRVWPNDISNEANLTQHIFMLRGYLGESARDHTHIITVPGLGYRLGFPVERKIGLTMKQVCERCERLLDSSAGAFICSYECTFCVDCAANLNTQCPNCGGELVRRPRRDSYQPRRECDKER